MLEVLGLRKRGETVVHAGRGSHSLISERASAILIEPFFGSSPTGLQATDEKLEKHVLARAIVQAVRDGFL